MKLLIKPTKITGWICTLLFLATYANAATTLIPGVLKRETWAGATRAQIEAGTLAATNATVTYPTSWDVPDDGVDNYAARYSGVVIPDTTGDYDFYVATDDDTDLFISTNDLPAGKYMIAQETSWSNARQWNTVGSGIVSQKRSDQWTNNVGVAPYTAGIHLVAGTRYYLEGDYHGGGGGNQFAVTMVPHGAGVSDGDATTLTNTLIGIVIPTPTTLSFTMNPSNTTAYVGMSGRFIVTTTTDSQVPPIYQWRRGGVAITNVTGPGYSIVASSADNNAQFTCVAMVPGLGTPVLTVTSIVSGVLTVPASGGLSVSGRLKGELYTNMTETAAGGVRTAMEAGNIGIPASTTAVTSLDTPSAGANYGERVSGYFTPSVTGRYVFFVASDDDSDLLVSTNDQPSGKRTVAQETVWSNNRNWNSSGGGSSLTQKRSDQWVPDPVNPPVTPPYADGIAMTAGTRYYIEAVHRAGGGGNGLSATFALTNDVALGIPFDGDASLFTNGVISYITTPVTIFAITTQPANVTVFEGFNYTFKVVVQTDSEITPTYQWRKNGTAVTGATANSYTALAAFADNNSHFSCDIGIVGVTNATSTTNTVTIQQGVVAVGQIRQEIWTNIPSSGVTRALVEANAPGTVPPPM